MWKKLLKNPFLWAFIIGILSLHFIRQFALMRQSAPEPMVIVPDWQLIDQQGQAFGKKDLLGKPFVADFFFTSCPSICPKLTAAMKEVYLRFNKKSDQVNFVSVTVDPTTDTSAVLQKYMKDNDIDYPNWHSLTGTKQAIYDVVVEKMRIHMGEKQPIDKTSDLYDIPHLGELALFDQAGNLRGLFKTDSTGLAALVRAVNFLVGHANNSSILKGF